MSHFFQSVGAALVGVAITIGGFLGLAHQAPPPTPAWEPVEQALGAALPSATAVFETSLAAPITSSATTLTLTANSVRGGGSLSGFNCFTIDEGTAQAETACGTVSGTSVTSLQRGISQSTGTTTVAALQFSHRRGASVKITDFPVIQILKAQNNGEDTFANILNYTSHPTFVGTTNIVDKKYVDDTAFSGAGVIDATTAARGVSELATGAEAAASTANGSSGVLVLSASLATSTYNSATAVNRVVVTGAGGKIDQNFINLTATSTAVIGSFPAYQIGKNIQNFTSTGTTTFTVPSGITKVQVQVQAAGGGGGGGNGSGTAGGGGGGGGYSFENVDVTGTTTIQLFVGAGGAGGIGLAGAVGQWSTFGTNGFYLSATGGGAGGGGGGNVGGGAGGVGSGGDINVAGTGGGISGIISTSATGGYGGSSHLGGGAPGNYPGGSGTNVTGTAGGNYGGGGGGGASGSSSSANTGGAGAQGTVSISW